MRPTVTAVLVIVLTLAAADPSEAVRRRAFVTSVTGTGNLASWPDAGGQAGLAAGNQICRNRAAAAGLPNANSYRAWLSTASTDAYCHLRGLTGKRSVGCAGGPPLAAGPWYRSSAPGSQAIAADLARLVTPGGEILAPVLLDEFGTAIDTGGGVPNYWTGTDPAGEVYPDGNCASWVSAAGGQVGVTGSALGTAQLWTLGTGAACGASLRLLCFEPGASEAVVGAWPGPAALVFLTSATGTGDLGSWSEAGGATGAAAGDAICRTLAADAGLPAPDSFVAWLSDSTQDARDRLTLDDPPGRADPGLSGPDAPYSELDHAVPFARLDGVVVATSVADLLDGANAGSIHQYETGAYKIGGGGGEVFSGTLEDGTASGFDCSDWASSAPADVTRGSAASTRTAAWTDSGATSCQYSQHLYCFSNAILTFWDGFESGGTDRWSAVAP
ncbi:MAG: hypothetical protein AMXMBFR36_00370 [Acidobacteriota bacterium]